MPNILIAVVGTSPAVVTETLQALADKNVAIDEMHIVTTTIGKERLFDALRSKGRFSQLCREYPGDDEHAKIADALLDMDPEHCCIPRDRSDGKELADITSEEDATLMADHICELVRLKTDKPENRVFASIAGGRKTMSFWLGCAMSLFGRPGDQLLHVLVNEPFESCEDFYFRPKDAVMVRVADDVPGTEHKKHERVSTDDAIIKLGDVPFPQFRPLLEKSTIRAKSRSGAGKKSPWLDLKKRIDVGKMMSEINLAFAGPRLTFCESKRTVDLGDSKPIELSAQYYALWKFCAEIALGQLPVGARPEKPGHGVITIEDFVSNGHWASQRLRTILDGVDAHTDLRERCEFFIGEKWRQMELVWLEDEARKDASQQAVVADKDYADADTQLPAAKSRRVNAGGVFEEARRSHERAVEQYRDALRLPDESGRKIKLDKLNEVKKILIESKEKRDQARQAVVDWEKKKSDAETRRTEANGLWKRLNAKIEADDKKSGSRKSTAETANSAVDGLKDALRVLRNHLGGVLAKKLTDPGLIERVKLVQGEKPFEIGLSEELRGASRIQFLP